MQLQPAYHTIGHGPQLGLVSWEVHSQGPQLLALCKQEDPSLPCCRILLHMQQSATANVPWLLCGRVAPCSRLSCGRAFCLGCPMALWGKQTFRGRPFLC